MKVFRGIDLTKLGDSPLPSVQGRTLVLDGDAAAYRAASTVVKLPTALRKFWSIVLTEMYLTNAEHVIVHLTSADCVKLHRKHYPTVKPYQQHRVNKDKPPLLEPLREGLVSDPDRPGYATVVLNRYYEADDAMCMDAYSRKDKDVIVLSADKDLRQVTQPYFDITYGTVDVLKDDFGWVDIATTPAGASKMVGHGHAFVLAQWLAGDPADNVVGLKMYKDKKIGPVGAVNLVKEWGSSREAALNTIKAYAAIKQDPLAELAMLWLLRYPEDSAFNWLTSLELPGKWQHWLELLHARHQQILGGLHEETSKDTAASMDD